MTDARSRRAKLWGVVQLAGSRVRYRLVGGRTRQTLLSVLGVALAVTLVLSVTSVALGLASQGSITGERTDYWIVPEESQGSAVTGVEGTDLGQVHPVTARLEQRSDVRYATPVLLDMIQVQSEDSGDPVRVFLVGIIPREDGGTVVGLPTDSLTPGDPYYANGSYNGTWTGEAVVSASAATALNVSAGDHLTVIGGRSERGSRTMSVTATSPARSPGMAQFPVVVVHLAEAQTLVGAAATDEADRILVDTTSPSAKAALEEIYPESEVVTKRGLLAHELGSSDLPFAMSIAAGLIAAVTGVLTVVTTMGFEIADDATSRAVMAALGVSRWTRRGLIALETLVTAVVGGIIGITGWLITVGIVNLAASQTVAVPVAVVRPRMAVYGLAAAVVVGLLSLPFIMLFTNRATVTEAMR